MPPSPLSGLSAIAGDYEAILCDVWGVVHDGLSPHEAATDALRRFRERGPVILMTNAPRPSGAVAEQLAAIGTPREAFDAIVSSGDVVRRHLVEAGAERVLHVGADRDLGLYADGMALVDGVDRADMVVLAGLVDDKTETPDDYRALMDEVAASGLPVVCANPDIVVERGDRLVHCAGALAALVEAAGGTVRQFGKPHPPIYRAALAAVAERAPSATRVLVIGDGLPTDIRGADNEGLDALFVTGGIHAEDFGDPGAPDAAKVAERLAREGLSVAHYAPRLAW
ncbi:TIGR01459 family HAD-type hydrolase [Acuticoccus sp.]|uniref:TIGR01459 family HAD-type hydrolase n=1 Tax=Acuticoccus sp. TaxID=1904378 RepID=UPI003B52CD5D